MSTITIREIEQDPRTFVNRLEAGESFVVFRGERAVAEVKPLSPQPRQPRPFGLCANLFKVAEDFDRSLPEEILAEFEGQ